jgi:ParB-like chromosome segregation protein Spo0J
VLGRDPDRSGLESYRKKIVDKGWSERDVENDLRRSAEYQARQHAESKPAAGAPRATSHRQ